MRKRQTPDFKNALAIAIFLSISNPALSFADFVETKTYGTLSGHVKAESAESIQFVDPDGKTRVIKKSDILFIEKENTNLLVRVRETVTKAYYKVVHFFQNLWRKTGIKIPRFRMNPDFMKPVQPRPNKALDSISSEMNKASESVNQMNRKNRAAERDAYADDNQPKKSRFKSLSGK